MAKKTTFFDDKILVLRIKKGVQFAWAKISVTAVAADSSILVSNVSGESILGNIDYDADQPLVPQSGSCEYLGRRTHTTHGDVSL